jgi:hypothetical protein
MLCVLGLEMPSSIHNKQGEKKLLILNVSLGPEMLREGRKEGKKDSSRNLKDCLPNFPLERGKEKKKWEKRKKETHSSRVGLTTCVQWFTDTHCAHGSIIPHPTTPPTCVQ